MPGDLPDAVAALLLDIELTDEERDTINPFWLLDLEFPDREQGCPTWAEHKAVPLPYFVRRNPGRRPSRWWRWDAPRWPPGRFLGEWVDGRLELPRMRLGGVGSALCEVFAGVEPRCYCGIPVEWVRTPEDLQECTEAGVTATMIDPGDPPTFEAQCAYLKRYRLAHARRGKAAAAPGFCAGERDMSVATKPSVRHEVERLLECVPAGLSADNMARIGRMRLSAVEEALRELEREGEAAQRSIVFRGAPLTVWRSR